MRSTVTGNMSSVVEIINFGSFSYNGDGNPDMDKSVSPSQYSMDDQIIQVSSYFGDKSIKDILKQYVQERYIAEIEVEKDTPTQYNETGKATVVASGNGV